MALRMFQTLAVGAIMTLAACGPASTPLPPEDTATATAAVPTTVVPADSATPTSTVIPAGNSGAGRVEGRICFPSEGTVDTIVYLEGAGESGVIEVRVLQDQTRYEAEVPAGDYVAYAWLPDYSFGGSYSAAVACGLTVECTDHSLVPFTVAEGRATGGVDICDWYGEPGSVPLPPNVDLSAIPSGAIEGRLNYPSEGIPAMQVVAFHVSGRVWYGVTTEPEADSYRIEGVPAGWYYVVAYPLLKGIDAAGGYTPAVACGLRVECADHSLIAVAVFAGNTTTGIDPWDWQPPGIFPASPAP